MTSSFDTIVIGGGSGGVAFATKAAELGASVCLIEKDRIGGTCVNRGCVPKKMMWEATWTDERARAACKQGLAPAPPRPDFGALQGRIAEKLETIRGNYGDKLIGAGVTRVAGEAKLISAQDVTVGGDRLSAGKVVLATGASPRLPDVDGIALAQTSDDVFRWKTLPASATLLGGGYIGCEFASILTGLGVKVHLVDPGERLLSEFDADIAELTGDLMRERGVEVHLGTAPTALRDKSNGVVVELDNGKTVEVERVIAAVGRAPQTDIPGGFARTLEIAETGAFAVDDGLQTSHSDVFAVGDCADRLPLTPVATRDGETLARRLFGTGNPSLPSLSLVARAAFTMPPIAQVGQPRTAQFETGYDLIEGALTPPEHWTARTGRKVAVGRDGFTGVAALGQGAPDIVTALGAALSGSDLREVTGVHPGAAEEFVGRS